MLLTKEEVKIKIITTIVATSIAQLQGSAHIMIRAITQFLMQEQNRNTDIPCRLENSSEMCQSLAGTNQTPAVSSSEVFELISTDV